MAQDHRDAVPGWERAHKGGERAPEFCAVERRLRQPPHIDVRDVRSGPLAFGIERGDGRPLPASAVPAEIERDPVEPGPHGQRPPPRGRVGLQGVVGAHERVLGDVLGVLPVARETEREPVEPILVGQDQALERPVEIGRQPRRQALVARRDLPGHLSHRIPPDPESAVPYS